MFRLFGASVASLQGAIIFAHVMEWASPPLPRRKCDGQKRIIRTAIAVLTVLASGMLAAQAEAGLVEDLRRGNSDIEAVWSGRSSASGWALQNYKSFLTKRDHKAMAMHDHAGFWLAWEYPSAAAAVKVAISGCENEWGGTCKVYAVGSEIVQGFSQRELANAIAALDPSYDDETEGKSNFVYCRKNDGSAIVGDAKIGCGNHVKISKAEYFRLKREQKSKVAASKAETDINVETDTVEASLIRLKRLLDRGLVSAEEAKIWRRELLGLPVDATNTPES